MTAILTSSDSTQQKVEAFIRLANAHGGTDNIAVGLWEPL
jgi:serine/threonine protein phosphatase PrpC